MAGFTRILVVEDNMGRVEQFRKWLPDNTVKLTHAKSAGQAIGVLRRSGKEYHGIMLDHDLEAQTRTASDKKLTGTDVARAVLQAVPRTVPILVHSMNGYGQAELVTQSLKNNGFDVTRLKYAELTEEQFLDWVEGARAD